MQSETYNNILQDSWATEIYIKQGCGGQIKPSMKEVRQNQNLQGNHIQIKIH